MSDGGTVSTYEIVCRGAVALVNDYLEGVLHGADLERFKAHLAHCDSCTEHLRQIRTTVALTGRLHNEDLDPDAEADLVALYRRWHAESREQPGEEPT